MVAPLIVGAARVAKVKRTLNKQNNHKSAIAQQRYQKMAQQAQERTVPTRRHLTPEEKQANNVHAVRNMLPYRSALRTATKGETNVKKIKKISKGVMVLGSMVPLMALQIFFGILSIASFAFDDSWWGWVDIIDAGLTIAGICWIIALLLGTYTMIIAAFAMAGYMRHWKILMLFFFCFSANWAPFLQVIPWVAVFVLYITVHKK